MSGQKLKVELGGNTYDVALPRSFAERRDIWIVGAHNSARSLGAAVGACVAGLGIKSSPKARKWDMAEFGGDVLDELHERGIPMQEIAAAGNAILDVLTAEMAPAIDEVKETADFTGRNAASTTSPRSESPADGVKSPAGSTA